MGGTIDQEAGEGQGGLCVQVRGVPAHQGPELVVGEAEEPGCGALVVAGAGERRAEQGEFQGVDLIF